MVQGLAQRAGLLRVAAQWLLASGLLLSVWLCADMQTS